MSIENPPGRFFYLPGSCLRIKKPATFPYYSKVRSGNAVFFKMARQVIINKAACPCDKTTLLTRNPGTYHNHFSYTFKKPPLARLCSPQLGKNFFCRYCRIGCLDYGTAHHDMARSGPSGLGGSHDPLLVARGAAGRPNARGYPQHIPGELG